MGILNPIEEEKNELDRPLAAVVTGARVVSNGVIAAVTFGTVNEFFKKEDIS